MKKTLLFFVAGFMLLDIAVNPAARGCQKKADTGKVAGVVTFQGLNCQPGQPDFNVPPCSGPYPNYKIEVYMADGKTLALTAMTDPRGNFSIDLPDGSYVIYTQNGPMEQNREQHDFKITKGKTEALNLNVSTGIL